MRSIVIRLFILLFFSISLNGYSKTKVNYLPICDPLFEECENVITKPQPLIKKSKPIRIKKRPIYYAGKKIALIIGNQAYKSTIALKNPVSDATAIARKLQQLGFKVTLLKNINQQSFKSKLYDFGRKTSNARIALIFYAGHALQIDGKNYLLPIDAPNMTKHEHIYKLINVKNDILTQISQAKVGIVILDACRNNPLVNNVPRSIRGRSITISRGLARITQTQGNTLVAYATKPGEIARDGKSNHSPFTQAILANLNKPIDIRRLFGMIRTTVLKLTDNQQDPEITVSLDGSNIILAR